MIQQNDTIMTYAQIEKELKENGFKHEFGVSPLKGMRFSKGTELAFVWVEKDGHSIKHRVEYV